MSSACKNNEDTTIDQQITDLEVKNQELIKSLSDLEESNDQKLRIITHDIAGAVQVMMLALDAIDVRPNETEKNIDRIRRATNRIMGIVHKLREERNSKILND